MVSDVPAVFLGVSGWEGLVLTLSSALTCNKLKGVLPIRVGREMAQQAWDRESSLTKAVCRAGG